MVHFTFTPDQAEEKSASWIPSLWDIDALEEREGMAAERGRGKGKGGVRKRRKVCTLHFLNESYAPPLQMKFY